MNAGVYYALCPLWRMDRLAPSRLDRIWIKRSSLTMENGGGSQSERKTRRIGLQKKEALKNAMIATHKIAHPDSLNRLGDEDHWSVAPLDSTSHHTLPAAICEADWTPHPSFIYTWCRSCRYGVYKFKGRAERSLITISPLQIINILP